MSRENAKNSEEEDELEENTMATSMSLSPGEHIPSLHDELLKNNELEQENENPNWWIKKPGSKTTEMQQENQKKSFNNSPEISSSTREFLDKEKSCTTQRKSQSEKSAESVTSYDYQSTFEIPSDEDIQNLLEEISEISVKSPVKKNSTVDLVDEKLSMEEILEEAQKLLKNSNALSKCSSKSNGFLPENADSNPPSSRITKMEDDIFDQIEAAMNEESEKMKSTLKKDSFEKKAADSSSSDSDDEIEAHSKSEELKNAQKFRAEKSLQKEITDVDKNFFLNLEGGMSNSPSLEQEDYSHLLKILGVQSASEPLESPIGDFLKPNLESKTKSPGYPEKEIAEILEKENMEDVYSYESFPRKEKTNQKNTKKSGKSEINDFIRPANEEKVAEARKINGSNDDLYVVDLTPRLELFADAIPKLIAERSNKEKASKKPEEKPKMPVERSFSAPERDDLEPRKINKAQSLEQLVSLKTGKKPEVKSKPPLMPRTKFLPKPAVRPKITTALKPRKKIVAKNDWETLYNEEKHKNGLLKQQIEAESKQYKEQIASMRLTFEQELFSAKKQNILLKVKGDEEVFGGKKCAPENSENAIRMMENELKRQEVVLKSYEAENKKLMQEAKKLKMKQRGPTMESIQRQKLANQVKELQEKIQKMTQENSDLRREKVEISSKSDDLSQQNSLLKDELEMFKEQLSIKNEFISTRLQVMSTTEMDLKKQMEDLKIELSSKTEQLKGVKLEHDKLQVSVLPLEKEVLELKAKESNLQEKLQISKSHMEREKLLSQKLKDQVIRDNKKIMDLTRQVREMERIIKRKHPDFSAALVQSLSAEYEKVNSDKIQMLEEKILALEMEVSAKEKTGHQKIVSLQMRLDEENERHAMRVIELKEKLLDQKSSEEKICAHVGTQTRVLAHNVEKESKIPRASKPANLKEDVHLLATIRGLKNELSGKDKTVAKLSKELQELQKTNNRLQKEREKQLFERKMTRSRTGELADQNSNVCQNGQLTNGQRFSESRQKLYDPMQFSENSDFDNIQRLMRENETMRKEIEKMGKEIVGLGNKRLQDLNLLQEEHEREITNIVKEYGAKIGDSRVLKLQGQLNSQLTVISHLRQQVEKLKDYKEQIVLLKAERDHLENRVKTLSEKVKYFSTPGTEQLQLLQDKIMILQQRHESREMTLQNMVRQLMRSRTQCRDCKGEKVTSRQLCYFRQELDQILAMLQEIANVQ